MALFGQSPITTTTTPTYAPGVSDILGLERGLLSQFILPLEQQSIFGLGALGRGQFGQAPSVLGPAQDAARLGQAATSALTSSFPSNVAVPIQEQAATQAQEQAATQAPDQLQALVQALIGPQFAGLFQPGSSTLRQGGGPSAASLGFGTGAAVLTALANLAPIVAGLL